MFLLAAGLLVGCSHAVDSSNSFNFGPVRFSGQTSAKWNSGPGPAFDTSEDYGYDNEQPAPAQSLTTRGKPVGGGANVFGPTNTNSEDYSMDEYGNQGYSYESSSGESFESEWEELLSDLASDYGSSEGSSGEGWTSSEEADWDRDGEVIIFTPQSGESSSGEASSGEALIFFPAALGLFGPTDYGYDSAETAPVLPPRANHVGVVE